MFKNTKVGDIIDFSVHLKAVGKARCGSKSVHITCTNRRTGEVNNKLSFNKIESVLDNFEFKEL